MGLASFRSTVGKDAFAVDTTDITFVQLSGEGEGGSLDIYIRNMQECITLKFPAYAAAAQVYDNILEQMSEDQADMDDLFDDEEDDDD